MTARTAAAGETVAQLVNYLFHQANVGGRYMGEEATAWRADVERRIRAAAERDRPHLPGL